jgi:hypothetical protein
MTTLFTKINELIEAASVAYSKNKARALGKAYGANGPAESSDIAPIWVSKAELVEVTRADMVIILDKAFNAAPPGSYLNTKATTLYETIAGGKSKINFIRIK